MKEDKEHSSNTNKNPNYIHILAQGTGMKVAKAICSLIMTDIKMNNKLYLCHTFQNIVTKCFTEQDKIEYNFSGVYI